MVKIPFKTLGVETPKPGEYKSSELGAAVTRSALNLAVQSGAVLGKPTCPSGVKRASTMAAQCVISFDKVVVAYTVTTDAAGGLVAAPAFVVVPRRLLESEVRKSTNTITTCGKESVVVVPSGAIVRCQSPKAEVAVQVFSTPGGWRVEVLPG